MQKTFTIDVANVGSTFARRRLKPRRRHGHEVLPTSAESSPSG
jgi:hypothetical protein